MSYKGGEQGHETRDQLDRDVPAGDGITDNEYKSRTGQSEIPVVSDDRAVESGVDSRTADSDEQLGILSL
jgi:hypothetical protein